MQGQQRQGGGQPKPGQQQQGGGQPFACPRREPLSPPSSTHDWTIRAHRHRNLFQILLIERGGGEMTYEAATFSFSAPAVILVPATVAHGFRFHPKETEGWVVSFTEDVTHALGGRSGEALARLQIGR